MSIPRRTQAVNPQPLTYGSLFSGVGGFDLGFDRAGFRCAWQVEKDDKARAVLTKHWPDVPKYEDVRNVGKQNLATVDVIVGGFPCQDISEANPAGRGLSGERSGLWGEYARIIREIQPRWVVIENVRKLLSINNGRDFARVLRDLAGVGYDAEWSIISACSMGAPHMRQRVFIVAYPQGQFGPFGIFQGVSHPTIERDQEKELRGENRLLPEVRSPIAGRSSIDRQWLPQPAIPRMAHGFPSELDEIRQLGNAVVPQIAEWIARRIAAVDGDE